MAEETILQSMLATVKNIENILTDKLDTIYPNFCPCCNRVSTFKKFIYRENAACPHCGALERHRSLAIHLNHYRHKLLHKKILHFAPEAPVRKMLESCGGGEYHVSDFSSKNSECHIDITDTKLKNDYFDCIVLSHVLEHIYDDTKALAELHRILAPSGIIFIMTPLLFQYLNHTYKRIDGTEMPHLMELDPDITFELKSSKKQLDPAIQLRLYGQSDHVRIYGKKALKEKCENSGFYVDIASYEAFESTYIKRAGLIDDVFILTKK